MNDQNNIPNEEQNGMTEEKDPFEAVEQASAFAQPIAQGTVINDETPENVGKGVLGILIGALAGIVLYNLLYAIGFVSAITGFVMAWISILLYGKFSGKPGSKKGVILTIVIGLIATFIAVYLAWTIALFPSAKEELGYTFFPFLVDLLPLLTLIEAIGDFVKDLLLALLFTALGAVSPLFRKQ
ncbi:MAG: hypothetical protein MJ070_09540 [Lachnospiraceae bacterium]|nr:hypothetical protein [Lachnospiraceae bacterium]